MAKNKRALGRVYEDRAAACLEEQGLRILQRNYQVRQGEIDLIAWDGEYLIFVEVKYRSTSESGYAICAVDGEKQKSICRAALHYLATRRKSVELPCRFDVVGFDGEKMQWIKNAFDFHY